ncbi:hypothetical protein [Sulfurimonas sp.]|uniref:hypothetical protein n=1 Tax=Sulfurimonas sp. TaxID=2022749 RepID=UPI003D0EAC2E
MNKKAVLLTTKFDVTQNKHILKLKTIRIKKIEDVVNAVKIENYGILMHQHYSMPEYEHLDVQVDERLLIVDDVPIYPSSRVLFYGTRHTKNEIITPTIKEVANMIKVAKKSKDFKHKTHIKHLKVIVKK